MDGRHYTRPHRGRPGGYNRITVNSTIATRRCTLDGFVSAVKGAEGVGMGDLDALTTVLVKTLNTLYRIIVLEPPHSTILIQGGTFFPEPTEARLAGASLGGSMLKLSWFGCGLRMEVCAEGQRIVTSPVQSIEVRRDEAVGPF